MPLSAVLVEPATGRTVASVREEAAGDSEFLPAVHRLANRVRARLGEALADIELSARALEKVTTPSLSALQLFSEADALIALQQGKSDVAEELLRQAVAEDPDFASGYMHLAWSIRNQRRPAPEYLPPAERAVALAERVSERERYFILGSYHNMLGQDEQAVTAYEALLRLYPRSLLGHGQSREYKPTIGPHGRGLALAGAAGRPASDEFPPDPQSSAVLSRDWRRRGGRAIRRARTRAGFGGRCGSATGAQGDLPEG